MKSPVAEPRRPAPQDDFLEEVHPIHPSTDERMTAEPRDTIDAAAAGERPAAWSMKFTYASGSRPLEGYTIKRGIGRGGFGEVYYAHSDAGKEVALKLIRRNFEVELRGVTQCLNLRHPNLLAVHDIRRDATDDNWVVMEYIAGDSLEGVIADHPQGMDPAEACRWMQGIAAGVAYLHDHGIVHRDLKPGNIFCDEGLVKIGDYGLSKFISGSRRSGQTESVGTVHYMAPEIANGRYGKEIDVYALGILFYEMLTGHVPFEGESVGEVLMKHLTSEPDLSRLAAPYRQIVARAMAKDPETRYRNAAELAAAIPKVEGADGAYRLPPAVQSAGASGGEFVPVQVIAGPPNRARASHEEVPAASRVPQEPIAAGIKQVCRDASRSWSNVQSTTVKILLLVFGGLLVLTQAGWLLPTALLLGIIYCVYLAVWTLVSGSQGTTSRPQPVANPQRAAVPVKAPPKRQPPPQPRWRRPVEARIVRTPRETAMDLSGAMLLGAIVCPIAALAMFLLRGQPLAAEQFAWVTLVSIAGTWTVMAVSKWFERVELESPFRRFVMLAAGLAIGGLAYGVQEMLFVGLAHEMNQGARLASSNYSEWFFAADGSPQLAAFLAYFGFLFFVLRWWRLADSIRGTRFSVWSVGVAAFWALAICVVWPFPQPWGLMTAATMAIAVQLGSPWWSVRRRRELSAQGKEG